MKQIMNQDFELNVMSDCNLWTPKVEVGLEIVISPKFGDMTISSIFTSAAINTNNGMRYSPILRIESPLNQALGVFEESNES